MTKIKKVGIWPVGLVGGYSAEVPVLDPETGNFLKFVLNNVLFKHFPVTGKVIRYKTGWKPDRPFATDMAGFAINLSLVLANPNVNFRYDMQNGYLESEFLSMFIKKHELEPLADNCTKVYVWHTRTEKTKVSKILDNLEV